MGKNGKKCSFKLDIYAAIKENILWFKKPSKYDKITSGFNLQNKRG